MFSKILTKKNISASFFGFFILIISFYSSVNLSKAQLAKTDPVYEDKTKYPEIEIKTNTPANDAIFTILSLLKKHKCLPEAYNDKINIFTDTSVNAVNAFKKANGIQKETVVGVYTWEALSKDMGAKTVNGDIVVDCGATNNDTSSNLTSGSDIYKNISSFGGESTSTTFTNTDTGGLGDAFNYILTLMAVAIIILIIFRILQGAITKGTFDNIYDQQKGKKIIETAGKALLVFISAYAILSFINPDLTGWTFIQSVTGLSGGSNSTGGGIGACKVDTAYNNSDIVGMLKMDEGVKKNAYYDSLGIPSIGVGYNLVRSNKVKDDLIAAGVSSQDAEKLASLKTDPSKANKDISGYPEISDAVINKLLLSDIETHKNLYAIPFAKEAGKDFNTLPEKLKKVLMDMAFMGDYSDFVKMNEALKNNDETGVAREIANSKYCGQVGQRCARLVGLVLGSCPSTIQSSNSNNISIYGQNYNSNTNISQNVSDLGNKSMSTPCPSGLDTVELITDYRVNGLNRPKIRLCRLTSIKGDLLSGPSGGKGALVNSLVAKKFQDMGSAYYNETGKYLTANSSTRTADSCGGSGSSGCAAPGSSPHQLGAAIDFNGAGADNGKPGHKPGASCSNPAVFNSSIQKWLRENASKYGIHQIPSESWHFEGIQVSRANC